MKKAGSVIFIMVVFGSLLFFERCTNKDETAINKLAEENSKKNDSLFFDYSKTLPGTNFFNLTSDGIDLYSLYSPTIPSVNFKAVRGKCDTSSGRYVILAQSSDQNLAYSNIILALKPTVSKILPLVAYEDEPLTANNAWATITIIKDSKTWRAINGNVYITVVDSNNIAARFDSVKVECISNISDTTYYKMSGVFFCK